MDSPCLTGKGLGMLSPQGGQLRYIGPNTASHYRFAKAIKRWLKSRQAEMK